MATAEVLTDGGTDADGQLLAAALERAGEDVHVVGLSEIPGERTNTGEPIFAVLRRLAAFADLVRSVPAERRADIVLLGDSAALLLSSLDKHLTPTQQGQLTICALEPAALHGEALMQPVLVRGRHARRALAALNVLAVPCDPAGAASVEAVEVRLLEALVARSALWLVCKAAGLHTPAELVASPTWLAELHALVANEVLPATRRLATGKGALDGLQDAEAVVERVVRTYADARTPVGEARRAWAERNGLLFSTEPDHSAQPQHRWLHCLAGQYDLLEPTDGDGGAYALACEEDAGVAPGAVFAAMPGIANATLERTVLLIIDATPAGVNGLILNRPTPIEVGEVLAGETGRFEAFRTNLLHAGGELGPGDSAPGDMVPIYLLHACSFLPDARELSSCAFLGGDSEMLAAAVAGGTLGPSEVRFFWRHVAFEPGEFQDQLSRGHWRRLPPHAWQIAC